MNEYMKIYLVSSPPLPPPPPIDCQQYYNVLLMKIKYWINYLVVLLFAN